MTIANCQLSIHRSIDNWRIGKFDSPIVTIAQCANPDCAIAAIGIDSMNWQLAIGNRQRTRAPSLDAGAHVFLDDYQRTGSGPIDVHALGVDFMVTGCLKYMLAAAGIGFL